MTIRVSAVIPAFNEERYLPRLLASVEIARRRYRGGPESVEVVVADNGSTDGTIRIAQANGCVITAVEPRVIAAVRNGGARAARGSILAFVDADAEVHPDTFNAIEDFFADGTRIVGASGVLLERRSWGINVTWLVLVVLTRLLRFDTGVICCRKEDWEAVGGYREHWRFAEDVWFLEDLKRLGRTRGQSFGRLSGVPSVFSTRKFDEHGEWHYMLLVFAKFPLWLLFSRGSIGKYVERYWYGRQRAHSPPGSG
ncbi:MAG TPA: glycosyltransferase [Gemmatimonadaceae bacterium]|nr:glycosyltransferase [Gemmatimonadaceae bacterium]